MNIIRTKAAPRIAAAVLLALAAAIPALAQTGAGTPLAGITPPAVVNGTAVAAGHYNPGQMLRLVFWPAMAARRGGGTVPGRPADEGVAGVSTFPDGGRVDCTIFAVAAERAGLVELGASQRPDRYRALSQPPPGGHGGPRLGDRACAGRDHQ